MQRTSATTERVRVCHRTLSTSQARTSACWPPWIGRVMQESGMAILGKKNEEIRDKSLSLAALTTDT